MSSARQSGADDEMVISKTQEEFRGGNNSSSTFKYTTIWLELRKSAKFSVCIDELAYSSVGQPSKKRSKTSSSADQQSQGSDARCNINLNVDEDEIEAEFNPRQPIPRPIGRDRARRAHHSSSSSGGRVDYTEPIQQVTTRLDGLLQSNEQRLNVRKEMLELAKRKQGAKENCQRQHDFQFLTSDTSNLSGPEFVYAQQMKQENRDKYNIH